MQGVSDSMTARIQEFSTPARPAGRLNAKFLRTCALVAIAGTGLQLGACSKISQTAASLSDVTGSIGPASAPAVVPTDAPGLQRYLAEWGRRYERSPDDKALP